MRKNLREVPWFTLYQLNMQPAIRKNGVGKNAFIQENIHRVFAGNSLFLLLRDASKFFSLIYTKCLIFHQFIHFLSNRLKISVENRCNKVLYFVLIFQV